MTGGSDLPLPDYDELSFGTLRHAIRSLGRAELEQVLEYERAHADRVQVKQLIVARIKEVAAGAAPSPGGPPAGPRPAGRTREYEPRVRPDTAAPPMNPPPHGVPTNAPSRRHDQG
jgi:hypothetical protein